MGVHNVDELPGKRDRFGAGASVSFPSSKRPYGIARPLVVGKSARRSRVVTVLS